jgi:hypothetical protein
MREFEKASRIMTSFALILPTGRDNVSRGFSVKAPTVSPTKTSRKVLLTNTVLPF